MQYTLYMIVWKVYNEMLEGKMLELCFEIVNWCDI